MITGVLQSYFRFIHGLASFANSLIFVRHFMETTSTLTYYGWLTGKGEGRLSLLVTRD